MSDYWQKYIAKYGSEPTDSSQLLKFSQLKDSGLKALNFKEAREIFDNNKGKKAISTTNNSTTSTSNNKSNDSKEEKPNDNADENARGGLFAELNQGTDITSGLKKVTSDMKTKNQPNRTGKVPDAKQEPPKDKVAQPKNDKDQKKKDKSIKKQGPRLLVEYYSEGVEELKEAEQKTEVNFYQCSNTGFLIPNKVKSVTIDSCKRIQIEINEVISSIEVINCDNITLYVKKTAPSITIDKSSQPKLFLFDEALQKDPNIITSMVTDMNISVQSGDDWNDIAVPYQFITKIDKNSKKATTVPVEHSA